MMFQSGHSLGAHDSGQSELVRKTRDLREELNWYYHRIELEQLRPERVDGECIERLQEQARAREVELLRSLRELPSHERESADRKSTRLNSSHSSISYAVFCL